MKPTVYRWCLQRLKIRSSSCKTVAHMRIGAPDAAIKVLGYSDATISSDAQICPMGPILAETAASFDIVVRTTDAAANINGGEGGSENDEDDGGDDDAGDNSMLSTFRGKITMSMRPHQLYRRRCHVEDTGHPFHIMS